MSKAVVLSSGGADSTTCIGVALEKYPKDCVVTVSVFYGQKHNKELGCAKKIAEYYGLKHYELDLSQVLKYSNCSLLSHSTEEVPEGSYAEQIGRKDNGMVATYVPFRNGLMLSAVASLASSLFPDEDVEIYLGAHADDAAGSAYADCSLEFVEQIGAAIKTGTYGYVTICCPFVDKTKSEVIGTGLKLGVPYQYTWSCYNGTEKPCGKCGTCIDRIEAFKANGVEDPLEYETAEV